MQGVFRKRCDDLVDAYVRASLKRERDAREIGLLLEGRMRRDRRSFRRRIATLEQEQRVSDRSIEELMWEVEQLKLRVGCMADCLAAQEEMRSRLEAASGAQGVTACDEWTRI